MTTQFEKQLGAPAMERPTHTEDYVSAYILRGHAPSILMRLQIKIKVTDTAAHVLSGLTQKLTDRTELHRYMAARKFLLNGVWSSWPWTWRGDGCEVGAGDSPANSD